MNTTYTIQEVKERLKSRKYFLKSLPSMQSTNFGMFYSERHDKYYRSGVSANSPAIGDIYDYSHEEIDAFLASVSETRYFTDFHFAPLEEMHASLHQLEDYVEKAEVIIEQLESDPTLSWVFSSSKFHLLSLPMLGWYAISNSDENDKGYYEFAMDTHRARGEVVNTLQLDAAAQCGHTLEGAALKRWESTSRWVKNSFPYGKKPGVYYCTRGKDCITYLSNGNPLEITYSEESKPKMIIEILQKDTQKHRDYLLELLKNRVPVTVLLEQDPRDTEEYEFFNLEQLFTVATLLELVETHAVYLRAGRFHESNYSVTDDCKSLHSHILNENYPIKEKLTELIKNQGFIDLMSFKREHFPSEVFAPSYNEPIEEVVVNAGAPPDEDAPLDKHIDDLVNNTVEEPAVIEKPYHITENWGLKIIKGVLPVGNLTLVQLQDKETELGLQLHESLTGIALKLLSASTSEVGEVKTYGFGSRLLIATTNASQETKWDYKTLPEDLMLTLKTNFSASTGLSIEINAFVGEEVLQKITAVLDKFF